MVLRVGTTCDAAWAMTRRLQVRYRLDRTFCDEVASDVDAFSPSERREGRCLERRKIGDLFAAKPKKWTNKAMLSWSLIAILT